MPEKPMSIEQDSVLEHMLQQFVLKFEPAQNEKSADLTLTFNELVGSIDQAHTLQDYEKKDIQDWLFIEGFKPVLSEDDDFSFVYLLRERTQEF